MECPPSACCIFTHEKTNKCNLCDFASLYANKLRRHLKTHGGEKTKKCNHCGFTSSQTGNLRTHLKMHSGEKSNKCNLCDYASSQASHLRRHLKLHSGVLETNLKCNYLLLISFLI